MKPLDIDAFLAALREIDYAGWLVVETGHLPDDGRALRSGRRRPAGEP